WGGGFFGPDLRLVPERGAASALAVADFDGNGSLDVAVASQGNTGISNVISSGITLFLSRPGEVSTTNFRPTGQRGDGQTRGLDLRADFTPISDLIRDLATGDLNEDGIADLVVMGDQGTHLLASAAAKPSRLL